MTETFSFKLLATDGAARRGEIVTPHGGVQTPAFMPVGTQATVKGIAPEAVAATGAEIVLGNTYHLMLRPGAERIAALGGLHKFMNWPRSILTDSGGFQVMSLSKLRKLSEQGVTFSSHLDGAMVELTPERAIEIQALLGADISMQLDECLRLPAESGEIARAMQLSLRWGERSKRAFETVRAGRALLGWTQGKMAHEADVHLNTLSLLERDQPDARSGIIRMKLLRAFARVGVQMVGDRGVVLADKLEEVA